MEVRSLLSQAMLDTSGHGSGNSTPRRPNPVVILTPPPNKPKELPQPVDTSSQLSALDDAEMAEASLEGVPTTISPIAVTTRSRNITPPADMAEIWENANKALEELLATKASIDTHRQRAIWELGMELCRNESATADSIKEARAICSCVTLDTEALCFATVRGAKVTYVQTIKEAKTTCTCTIWEAKAACSVAIRDAKFWGASQAKSLHWQHGKAIWDLEAQVIQEEGRSQTVILSTCQAALHASPAELKGMLVASYHILLGQALMSHHSPYHKRPPQWSNSLPQQLLLSQCPSSLLGPKGGILPQTLWTACLWVEPHPRQPQKGPQLQTVRCPTLEQGAQAEPLRSIQDTDLVKEARKDYFSKHSYNFTMKGTCDLLEVFKWMAKSAKLLGTSIHEIQAVWMGLDELRQANYALRSLPKGLKFLHAVPPSKSPKVMGLVGIHDPDALCHFSGLTHCPWCGKEGQNEGTVVNHLQTVYYRLGLVCNKCKDCPSTSSDTLHCHGQQNCQQPGEKIPDESVLSE